MNRYLDEILSVGLARRPHKPALINSTQSLSFAELDKAVDEIVQLYQRFGCLKGHRIAVVAQKSPQIAAFVIACWRIGCIYVPLDPTSPPKRLQALIEEIAPQVICISDDNLSQLLQLSNKQQILSAERFFSGAYREFLTTQSPLEGLPRQIVSRDAAYCIYTSGSTGSPNGVVISHGSCESFFTAIQVLMKVDTESVFLGVSPLVFDVSIFDLFYPLYMGATVYMLSPTEEIASFGEVIQSRRITHFCATSPILTAIAKRKGYLNLFDFSSVDVVMTGADLLDQESVQNLLERAPGIKIVNGYGPTEATCICTAFVIDGNYVAPQGVYPIGRPLEGIGAVLLDDGGAVVDGTGDGELLVSGPQLMSEYWRKPAETRARLVVINDVTYYRTGDRVKRDKNGDLIFLGRIDHEVKISGIRIHLNEIRYALMKISGIEQALVTTRPTPLGRDIVAAVQISSQSKMDQAQILRELRQTLPTYMVPKRIRMFPTFPLLPSGKLDQQTVFRSLLGGTH